MYVNHNYGGERVAQTCFSSAGYPSQITLKSRGSYRGVSKRMVLTVCEVRASTGASINCRVRDNVSTANVGPIQSPGGCLRIRAEMWNGRGTRIVDSTDVLCN